MDAQAKYYKSCLTHVEDMLPDIRCMIGKFTHCCLRQCGVSSDQSMGSCGEFCESKLLRSLI